MPQDDNGRKRKEKDEIKIGALPKSAQEFRTWIRTVFSAVSTAAYDPVKAKPWIWKLRTGQASYEDLRYRWGTEP